MPDPPDPAGFVESVRARFDDAVQRVGGVEVDLRLADRHVRLVFAGEALVPQLLPALAHRVAPDSAPDIAAKPDLVLCVWDSASTATPLPPPPWSWDRYCTRGDIDGYNTETVRTAYTATLNVFDSSTGIACWWIPDTEVVPVHEVGAPFSVPFHWWLETVGMQMVHGASIGPPAGGGVLLAGDGGAGKSSTALACLRQGWSYAGDDYCVVDTTGTPVAHGLYATAKADDAARARAGGVTVAREVPLLANRGKSLLFLSPRYDEQLAPSLPIDAILLPRVSDRHGTELRPATALETTRALTDSTMRQLPGAGNHAWRTLAGLAREVPAYHLELGQDADAITRAMASAINGEEFVA